MFDTNAAGNNANLRLRAKQRNTLPIVEWFKDELVEFCTVTISGAKLPGCYSLHDAIRTFDSFGFAHNHFSTAGVVVQLVVHADFCAKYDKPLPASTDPVFNF